jgi:hypothetical protein
MDTTTLARTKFMMTQADLKAAVLACVSGISYTRLAASLRGEVYLGAEMELELYRLTARIFAFKKAVAPLELPKNATALIELLNSGVEPEQLKEALHKVFGTNAPPNGSTTHPGDGPSSQCVLSGGI